MKQRIVKKWGGVVICLLLAIVFAVAGFFTVKRESTASVPASAYRAAALAVPEKGDTDITMYSAWEDVTPAELDVYPATTLWDIKTRLTIKASVQRSGSGIHTGEPLLPNEFNISVTVSDTTYRDNTVGEEEGDLSAQPFYEFKDHSGSFSDSYVVTLTPVTENAKGDPVPNFGLQAQTITVNLKQQPKVTGPMTVTPKEGEVFYPSTRWRTFTIHEFFYKTSIKATVNGKPDTEVPREYLTAQFTEDGVSAFTQAPMGGNTRNGVAVSYQNADTDGGDVVTYTLSGTAVIVNGLTYTSAVLEPNVGDYQDAISGDTLLAGTVRQQTDWPYYYRIGLPESFSETEDGGISYYNPDSIAGKTETYYALNSGRNDTYFAFVASTSDELIGYSLRLIVTDSGGGETVVRCDNPLVALSGVPASSGDGTQTALTAALRERPDITAPTIPTTETSSKIPFYQRQNLRLLADFQPTGDALDPVTTASLTPQDLNKLGKLTLVRVERDGRCYTIDTGDARPQFGVDSTEEYFSMLPVTYYEERSQTTYYDDFAQIEAEPDGTHKNKAGTVIETDETLSSQNKSKFDYKDGYYTRYVRVYNNTGRGTGIGSLSAWVPVKVQYKNITGITIGGNALSTYQYAPKGVVSPSGLRIKFSYDGATNAAQGDYLPITNDRLAASYGDRAGYTRYGKPFKTSAGAEHSIFYYWRSKYHNVPNSTDGAMPEQRMFGSYGIVYYSAKDIYNYQQEGAQDWQKALFTDSKFKVTDHDGTYEFDSPLTRDGNTHTLDAKYAKDIVFTQYHDTKGDHDVEQLRPDTVLVRFYYLVRKDEVGNSIQTNDVLVYRDFVVGEDIQITRTQAAVVRLENQNHPVQYNGNSLTFDSNVYNTGDSEFDIKDAAVVRLLNWPGADATEYRINAWFEKQVRGGTDWIKQESADGKWQARILHEKGTGNGASGRFYVVITGEETVGKWRLHLELLEPVEEGLGDVPSTDYMWPYLTQYGFVAADPPLDATNGYYQFEVTGAIGTLNLTLESYAYQADPGYIPKYTIDYAIGGSYGTYKNDPTDPDNSTESLRGDEGTDAKYQLYFSVQGANAWSNDIPSKPGYYSVYAIVWGWGNFSNSTSRTINYEISKMYLTIAWQDVQPDNSDEPLTPGKPETAPSRTYKPLVFNGKGYDPYDYLTVASRDEDNVFGEKGLATAWTLRDNETGMGDLSRGKESLVNAGDYTLLLSIDTTIDTTTDTTTELDPDFNPRDYYQWATGAEEGHEFKMPYHITRDDASTLRVIFTIVPYTVNALTAKADPTETSGKVSYLRRYAAENTADNVAKYEGAGAELYGFTPDGGLFGQVDFLYFEKSVYGTAKAAYDADVQSEGDNAKTKYPQGFYSFIMSSTGLTYDRFLAAALPTKDIGKYVALAYLNFDATNKDKNGTDWGNYNYAEDTVEFEIGKRLIALPTLEFEFDSDDAVREYTYTGREIRGNITGFFATSGAIEFNDEKMPGLAAVASNSSAYVRAVNAKTYKVYLSLIKTGEVQNNAWKVTGWKNDKTGREFFDQESEDENGEWTGDYVLSWTIYRAEVAVPAPLTHTYELDTDGQGKEWAAQYNDSTSSSPLAFSQMSDRKNGLYADDSQHTSGKKSVYAARDAGTYSFYVEADENHYISDGETDNKLRQPETAQPWTEVKWTIERRELKNIVIGSGLGLTYNGNAQVVSVNNEDVRIMDFALTGQSYNGQAFTDAVQDSRGDMHYYWYETIIGGQNELFLYVTYAGTYTLTATIQKDAGNYDKNFYWEGHKDDEEPVLSYSVEFTVNRAEFKIDWGTTSFGYDGKPHSLTPTSASGTGSESFTITPVNYAFDGGAPNKHGDKVSVDGKNLPTEAGDYMAVVTRKEIVSPLVSKRSTLPATYKGGEDSFYLIDNFYITTTADYTDEADGDGTMFCKFTITSSLIDLPTLLADGSYDSSAKLEDYLTGWQNAIVVTYKGAAFNFEKFITDWASGDTWSKYLTLTDSESGNAQELTVVKWTSDKDGIDYYIITVAIKDPDNYAWDWASADGNMKKNMTAGCEENSAATFTFYLKIDPRVLDLPTVNGSANTYTTPYADKAQKFTDGFNYADYAGSKYGSSLDNLVSVFGEVGGNDHATEAENVLAGDGVYTVQVELADQTNFIWKSEDGGVDNSLTALNRANKTFNFKITPVALKTAWTDTIVTYDYNKDDAYTAKPQKPTATIANEFASAKTKDNVVIAFTLAIDASKYDSAADEMAKDQATIKGDSASNAGYYIATVSALSGDDAVNYTITSELEGDAEANATRTTTFVINKKGIDAPDKPDGTWTYTAKEQTYYFATNNDAKLMEVTNVEGKPDGVEGDSIDAGTYGAADVQDNKVGVKAIHAGDYTVKLALKDGGNFYWNTVYTAAGGGVSSVKGTEQEPSAPAMAANEYVWTIAKKEIKAPVLAEQRGTAFSMTSGADFKFYPDLAKAAAKDNTITQSGSDWQKELGSDWKVTFRAEYYKGRIADASSAENITAALDEKSNEVGYYFVKLILKLEGSDLVTDYVWASSGNGEETVEHTTYSLADDKPARENLTYAVGEAAKDTLVIYLEYRITRGRYELTFKTVDSWTYGDLLRQTVTGNDKAAYTDTTAPTDGDFKGMYNGRVVFMRTTNIPTQLKKEQETRSIKYFKATNTAGDTWTYDANSPLAAADLTYNYAQDASVQSEIKGAKDYRYLNDITGYEGTADNAKYYIPAVVPFRAGNYVAVITYDENGYDSSQGTNTLEEIPTPVQFTIKQRDIKVEWGDASTVYDGNGHMMTANVKNYVTTPTSDGSEVIDSELTLEVKIQEINTEQTYPGVTFDGEGRPIDVHRAKYSDEVKSFAVYVSEVGGAASENYRLAYTRDTARKENGYLADYTIQPMDITLEAEAQEHVYGTSDKVGGADISGTEGAYTFDYRKEPVSEQFLSRDTVSFAYFYVHAVRYQEDGVAENLTSKSPVTPDAGYTYHTQISLNTGFDASLKNYKLNFVDGVFTVKPMEVEAITWTEESGFTFNGKDLVKAYNDAHSNAPFVYFADEDGRPVSLTPDVSKTDEGEISGDALANAKQFVHAGAYTLTVTKETNQALIGEGANYTLKEGVTLTHDYSIAKRSVTIKAKSFTTQFSKAPTDSDLGWEYAGDSLSSEANKFVTHNGTIIGGYDAGEPIIDGVAHAVLTFKTATELTTETNAGEKADTWLTNGVTRDKLTGTIEYKDYSVTISAERSEHTIEQLVVEIHWDNETSRGQNNPIEFTYNGKDQTRLNGVDGDYIEQLAYFNDEKNEKRYLRVAAVTSSSSSDVVPFIDVKDAGDYYVFCVMAYGENQKNYRYNLENIYHEQVLMKSREVTVNGKTITGHEFGDEFGEELGWDYPAETGDEGKFVGGFESNIQITTTCTAESGVETYQNALQLTVTGSSVEKQGAGSYYAGGTVGRNYHITFNSADVTVVQRRLVISFEASDLTNAYGETVNDLVTVAKATLKREGSKSGSALIGGVQLKEVLDIWAATDESSTHILDYVNYPNAATYSVFAKLMPVSGSDPESRKSTNYAFTISFKQTGSGSSSMTVNTTATEDIGAKYTVTKSQLFAQENKVETKSVSADEGFVTYSGNAYDAFESFSIAYKSNAFALHTGSEETYTKATESFTPSAANNNLKFWFRTGSTDESDPFANVWEDTNAASGTPTGEKYTWSTDMPTFTRAGTYYVYYAVTADNHEPFLGTDRYITVVISKQTLTVSTVFDAYYGQSLDGFTPTYTYDGFVNGENLTDHLPVGYSAAEDKITMTVPGYVAGETGAISHLAVTLTFESFTLDDYNVVAKASSGAEGARANSMQVKALPVTVTVYDQTNKYYLNNAMGESQKETAVDLNVIGKGYTLTVDATSAVGRVTGIFEGDYTEGKTGVKFFKVQSPARPDGCGSGTVTTAAVGSYDINVTLVTDKASDNDFTDKYDITYERDNKDGPEEKAQYVITEAELNVKSMHGYGQANTMSMTYDEKEHFAVHSEHATDGSHNVDDEDHTTPAGFATGNPVSGKSVKWEFVLTQDNAGESYKEDSWWGEQSASATNPKVIDAGEYFVYYRVTLENHTTVYGKVTPFIKQAANRWTRNYTAPAGWTYGGYTADTNIETLPIPAFHKAVGSNDNVKPVVTLWRLPVEGGAEYTQYMDYAPDFTDVMNPESWFPKASGSAYTNGALLPAGTYQVRYSMPGNGNYTEIVQATATFTVAEQALTVKAKDRSVIYGAAHFTDSAYNEGADNVFVYTITGFVNGDDNAKLFGTSKPTIQALRTGTGVAYARGYLNGSATQDGISYYIQVRATEGSDFANAFKEGGAAASYKFVADDSGVFTVEKRELTITIQPLTNRYNFNVSDANNDDPNADVWTDGTVKYRISGGRDRNLGFTVDGVNEQNFANAAHVFDLVTEAYTFKDGNHTTTGTPTGTKDVGVYPIYDVVRSSSDNNGTDYARNYSLTFEGLYTAGTAENGYEKYNNIAGVHTIEKAQLTINIVRPDANYLVYSGEKKEIAAPTVAGASGEAASIKFTVNYQKRQSGEYQPVDAGNVVDVGDYRVIFEASDPNYAAGTANLDFSITKKMVFVTATMQKYEGDDLTNVDGSSYEYYGKAYKYLLTWGKDGSAWNDGKVVPKDAETFTVKETYQQNKNSGYVNVDEAVDAYPSRLLIESSSGNYDVNFDKSLTGPRTTQTFTIAAKVLDSITDTTGGTEKTYNGAVTNFSFEHYLTDTDSRLNGVLSYATDRIMTVKFEKRTIGGGAFEVQTVENFDTDNFWAIINAGVYRVTFSLTSKINYHWDEGDATDMSFTYTIQKKELYVRMKPQEIVYGEDFSAETSELEFNTRNITSGWSATNGFEAIDVDGSSVKPGVYDRSKLAFGHTYTNTTAVTSGNGISVDVNLSTLTAENYTFSQAEANAKGTIKVTPRPITVKVKDGTSVYSASQPEIGEPQNYLEITNGTPNSHAGHTADDLSFLGAEITVGGKAGAAGDVTSVGAHMMTATNGNSNYAVTFAGGSWAGDETKGTWTVTRKTLTVTLGLGSGDEFTQNGTLTFGDMPVYGATYAGFEGSDANALTARLFAALQFTAMKDATPYAIGAHAGEEYTVSVSVKDAESFLDNYSVTFIDGSFTVVSRTITLNEIIPDGMVREKVEGVAGNYEELPAIPGYGNLANSGSDIMPSVVLTYTGTLDNPNPDVPYANTVPTHAGTYQVTVTLQQNSEGQYDYVFGPAEYAQTRQYKVKPLEVEVSWDSLSIDLGEAADGKGTNTLNGYRKDIMNFSFTFGGIAADEMWDEDSKTVTFERVGAAVGNISLKEEHGYNYDYVLKTSDGSLNTAIQLFFNVFTSDVDFRVSIKGWVYGAYDEVTNAPVPESDEIRADRLAAAKILYTYVAIDAGSYDKWVTDLAKLADKDPAGAEERARIRVALDALNFTQILPVNAGCYLIRADLPAITDLNVEGAIAYGAFKVKKATAKVLSLESTSGLVYTGAQQYVTVKDNYDAEIYSLSFDQSYLVTESREVQFFFTDAGSYQAKITLHHPENYKWEAGSGEFDGSDESEKALLLEWKVEKATVTITMEESYSFDYGEAVSVVPTSDFGTVTVSYQQLGGTPISEEQLATITAGTYTVIATVEADPTNWEVATRQASLFINKATLTLTADNASVIYGEDAVFSYTASGWLYSDGADLLEGSFAKYTTTYVKGTSVVGGSYTVTVTGLTTAAEGADAFELDNYTVEFAPDAATVEVTKRPVRIVVKSGITEVFSGEKPLAVTTKASENWMVEEELSGYFDILKADEANITVTLSVPESESHYGVGTYEITLSVSGDAAANYDFSIGNGTMEITRLRVEVSGMTVPQDKVYNYGNAIDGFDAGIDYTATYTDNAGNEQVQKRSAFSYREAFYINYTGTSYQSGVYNSRAVPTLAGAYRATITARTDTGFELASDFEISGTNFAMFEIKKLAIDSTALDTAIDDMQNFYYNGTPQGPDAAAIVAKSAEVYGGHAGLYTVDEVTKETNAGTYTSIYVRLADSNNFVWQVMTDTELTETPSEVIMLSFTIQKGTLTAEFKDYANDAEWEYDGRVDYAKFNLNVNIEAAKDARVYYFYKKAAAEAPSFDSSNLVDWQQISETEMDALQMNAELSFAANKGVHYIVAYFEGNDNYDETHTAVAAYTVTARKVKVTVNGGNKSFDAGVYSEGLKASDLGMPAATYENAGSPLRESASFDFDDLTPYLTVTIAPSGNGFDGKPFDAASVKAGNYNMQAELATSISDGALGAAYLANFEVDEAASELSTYTYVVRRASVYADNVKVEDIPYDGQKHGAKEAVEAGHNVNYGKLYRLADEEAGKDNTEVNVYSFEVELIDQDNYYWASVPADETADDLSTTTRTRTYAITATTITVELETYNYTVENGKTAAPGGYADWVYGDTVNDISATIDVKTAAEAVLTADMYGTYVIEYRPVGTGDEWTSVLPTAAGNYLVRVRVPLTNNFSAEGISSEHYTVTVRIAKKALDETALTIEAAQYDGTEKTGTIANFDPLTMYASIARENERQFFSVSGETGTVRGMTAGEYIVTVSLRDSANYKWTTAEGESVTVTWTIRNRDNVVVFEYEGVIYGDTLTTRTFLSHTTADYGTPTFTFAKAAGDKSSASYGATLPKDAGDYWVKVVIEKSTNYERFEEIFDFHIDRATLTVTHKDYTITYGDDAPAFTRAPSYSGWQYDDAGKALYHPALSTTYVKGDAEHGKANSEGYPITDSASRTLTNYNVEVTEGKLFVERKQVTVTLLQQSTQYAEGAAKPEVGSLFGDNWTAEFLGEAEASQKNDGKVLFADSETFKSGIECYIEERDSYVSDSYPLHGKVKEEVSLMENYDVTFVDNTFNILPCTVEIEEVISPNAVYGAVQPATFKLKEDSTAHGDGYTYKQNVTFRIVYYADNAPESYDVPVDSGIYNVDVRLEGSESANYTLTGFTTATLGVQKAKISVSDVQTAADDLRTTDDTSSSLAFSFMYDGSKKSVSNDMILRLADKLKTREDMFPVEKDRRDGAFTGVSASGTDVGSYGVELTLTEAIFRNYTFDNELQTATIYFTITQATSNEVTVRITSGEEYVTFEYDGNDIFRGGYVTVSATFGEHELTFNYYKDEAKHESLDSAPVDAGTYYVEVVVPGTDNYVGATSDLVRVIITPRRLVATVTARDGVAFDNARTRVSVSLAFYETPPETHQMVIEWITTSVTYFGTSNDGTVYNNATVPTLAGNGYEARVRLAAISSNDYNKNFVLVGADGSRLQDNYVAATFNVAKATLFLDDIKVTEFSWDGDQHSAIDAIKDNEDYDKKYVVLPADNVSSEYVGRYAFYVTLKDPDNYCWESPNAYYPTKADLAFTIVKTVGRLDLEFATFYGQDAYKGISFTYSKIPGEEANTLILLHSKGDHELVFGRDFHLLYAPVGTELPSNDSFIEWTSAGATPEGWSRTISGDLVNAGNYIAIAWVHTDGYNAYSVTPLSYTIKQYAVKVTLTKVSDGVYDKSAPEFSAVGYAADDTTGTPIDFFPALLGADSGIYKPHTVYYVGYGDTTYTRSTVLPTEAGTYRCELVLSDNYSLVGEATCTFTIEQQVLAVGGVAVTETDVLYDGTVHFLDKDFVEGQFKAGVVTVTGGLPFTEGVVNAGEYAVELRLNDTRNYRWDTPTSTNTAAATVTYVVLRSTVVLELPAIEGWTYGAQPNLPAVQGIFENGSPFVGDVAFEYAPKGSALWTSEVPVNAGEYVVRAVLAEDGNHTRFVTGETSFTIARAKLAKLTADDAVKDDKGTYTFIPDGYQETLLNLSGNTATADGSHRATASIKDKNNYEWEDGTQDDLIIEWIAARNPTAVYITLASLGGSLVLAAGLFVVLMIVRKKQKAPKNGQQQ